MMPSLTILQGQGMLTSSLSRAYNKDIYLLASENCARLPSRGPLVHNVKCGTDTRNGNLGARSCSEMASNGHHGSNLLVDAVGRRHMTISALSFLLTAAGASQAAASEEAVVAAADEVGVPATKPVAESFVYEDISGKYSFAVPAEWEMGEGQSGARKVVAFFPPAGAQAANVNMVVTPIGADFTALGSFGTAYDFGQKLVNSMDRSWKKPPGQKCELINAKEQNGMYVIEYLFQKPGEPKLHFVSAVAVGRGKWFSELFTLTGQSIQSLHLTNPATPYSI
eukprot:TRINITY_DN926_c0_g1_i1.p1 TRINITY_DN926_c0_g1~~TRINITY_DN926_c0_g1_i1.p1  ORF type:complete len:281 (-),score=60.23 TRINITY_DN926_c0_g1_i1:132-974(-)